MSTASLQSAINLIKAGNLEQGKKVLNELICEEPNNQFAWFWMAVSTGDLSEKREALTKVLEINPANENARRALEQVENELNMPTLDEVLSNRAKQASNYTELKFVPAICPKCGGQLEFPKDLKQAKCYYCGTDILIQDPTNIRMDVRINVDTSKYMKLAQVSEESSNFAEAYRYYNQVLEHDGTCVEAWLGKARSTVMLTSLADPRFNEFVVCVSTAMQHRDLTEEESENAALTYLGVTQFYAGQCDSDLQSDFDIHKEFDQSSSTMENLIAKGANAALRQTLYQKFENISGVLIRTNLEYAWHLAPTAPVANEIMKTVYIVNEFVSIDGTRKQNFGNSLQPLLTKIRQALPDWTPPEQKKKGCFIATATMGDYNHPDVLVLRKLRDQKLSRSRAGRTFIRSYYRLSPPVATAIAHSPALQFISRCLIVRPCVWLSNRWLYSRR